MAKSRGLWKGAGNEAQFGYFYHERLAGNTHPNATGMAKMIKSGKRGL